MLKVKAVSGLHRCAGSFDSSRFDRVEWTHFC